MKTKAVAAKSVQVAEVGMIAGALRDARACASPSSVRAVPSKHDARIALSIDNVNNYCKLLQCYSNGGAFE